MFSKALLFGAFALATGSAYAASAQKTLHVHGAFGTDIEHMDFQVEGPDFKWQTPEFTCNGESAVYQIDTKSGGKTLYVRIGTQAQLAADKYVASFSTDAMAESAIEVFGPECREFTEGDARTRIRFVAP